MRVIRGSTNESFELWPGEKIQLFIYSIKDNSNIYLDCKLRQNASLAIKYIAIGVNGTVKLNFEQAESSKLEFSGVFALKNTDLLDFEYKTAHLGANSKSSFSLVGSLDGKAIKTSSETIDFRPGAIGAVGSESEKVTLFSNNCKNIAKPIILCGEENIHGTHNFNSGHLDMKTIDYLRSRGVDIETAKKIIAREQILRVAKLCKDENIIKEIEEALK